MCLGLIDIYLDTRCMGVLVRLKEARQMSRFRLYGILHQRTYLSYIVLFGTAQFFLVLVL